MEKEFSIKDFFVKLLLILPIVYIVFGWWVGIYYATKPVVFGPYEDVPVVLKYSILGNSLKEISGGHSIVMLAPLGKDSKPDEDGFPFNIKGYFEIPGSWSFDFPPAYDKNNKYPWKKSFNLTGSLSRAVAHELNKPNRSIGYYSLDEFNEFLKSTNRTKDIERLKPYLFWARFEDKYPFLYSESVLLSHALGNIFSDSWLPYDFLGIYAIVILSIALILRSIRLWLYYLYWVFAYWFGRIGYHDPTLAFSNEGWSVIGWSFWHRFICNEGRIFLIIAFIVSIIGFVVLGYVYVVKHFIPRKKRELEDFFKIDKDIQKRKEVAIESVEFEKVKYDINRKLSQYVGTDKYFLAVTDDQKDITVEENMLNHHLHVLGPTGSGKTSLAILPLSRQAIEKGRGCCFIDFKGDEVFKRYVQLKAKEKGKNFYYFSIDPKETSVGYNPLSSGDIHSKVDRIMTALELMYQGPAGFYSNVQAMAFIELLKEIIQDKKEINFSSVRDSLENPHFLRRIDVSSQEVKGLLAAISWIGGLKVITRDELDLAEVIKNGDIVFFALKSQVNTRLAEAIGRMLIIDLKFQAASRTEADLPYFIFIDEFQNLACSHFVDVISKVRSANFCLVLSNQSRGNLSSVSPAFENAIFTNTATKIVFMQEDPQDAKFWSDKTGETTYQDKNILQFDGMSSNGINTNLDGLRSNQGSIYTAKKNYISANVFLRLPFKKSVVFSRGSLACIVNHEFLFDRIERDRLVSIPFENNSQ